MTDIVDNSNNINRFTFIYTLSNCFSSNNIINKTSDTIIIFISFSSIGYSIFCYFFINNVTAIGYFLSFIFSSLTFYTIKKMRLQASLQKSVNTLKEENDELKENNEDLKENIDDLEDNINSLEKLSNFMKKDLIMLKESIGLFGNNSEELIKNLRDVYDNLKSENLKNENINKNRIYLHILEIVKYYDTSGNYIIKKDDVDKSKLILLNAFPNSNFNNLNTNKKDYLTIKEIYDCINL